MVRSAPATQYQPPTTRRYCIQCAVSSLGNCRELQTGQRGGQPGTAAHSAPLQGWSVTCCIPVVSLYQATHKSSITTITTITDISHTDLARFSPASLLTSPLPESLSCPQAFNQAFSCFLLLCLVTSHF